MDAAADRPEFEPPRQGGMVRGFSLAVLAHLLLIAALTWGLRWNTDPNELAAEAELWSSLPQQAAPKEVVAPPPPPPKPVVREQPKPEPVQRDADIALEREREKKRKEAEERERQKKLEAQRKQEELKKAEEQKKQEQAKLAAAEKRKKEEEDKKRREKEQEQLAKKLREENIERARRLAGPSQEPSPGAAQSAGSSAQYAGRLAALFRRNITYPGGVDSISGNPRALLRVTVSPTGAIISARLARSSGNPSWDDAALRAVQKTERIPANEKGQYERDLEIRFGPKD